MLYSPLRASDYQLAADLTSSSHFRGDIKSHTPAAVSFLNQDYCYKSVATQISHDAGLATVKSGWN